MTTSDTRRYRGSEDKSLPSHVLQLKAAQRAAWAHAWNTQYEVSQDEGLVADDCETYAIAAANGAVKAMDTPVPAVPAAPPADGAADDPDPVDKDMLSDGIGWAVWGKQISQTEAAYDSIGGTAERACGNCRWFVTPNGCIIVRNDPEPINPNGISNRYEVRPERTSDPLEVVIVEEASAEASDADKAETKREGGVDFPPADFASVPDAAKPSTWKLRLAETSPGNVTVAQVGRAITALQPSGFRGRRVQLSSSDRKSAISKISGAIGRISGASPEQKKGLRERLDKVKTRTIQAEVPVGLLQRAKDALAALVGIHGDDDHQTVQFYKDAAGDIRWVMWASNRWRDHDNPPEILTEKAHLDFVDYVDRTGDYPEAWLWHTPGTRWGQADMVDYADGFLIVSGTVDKGMEHVADSLAAGGDLGVSHGFQFTHSDKKRGIIGWYKSFEVSPLPIAVAANAWTAIDVIAKELLMFSTQKRAFLVGHLGESTVAGLEGNTEAMKAALEAKGVEWKALEDVPEAAPPAADAGTGTPAVVADVDQVAEATVKAMLESTTFKDLVIGQADQVKAIKGLADRLDALEKTDDAKIAAAVRGRVPVPNGHVASQSAGNVKDAKDGEDAPGPAIPEANIIAQAVEQMLGGPGLGPRPPASS